jgi:hypothetical protein
MLSPGMWSRVVIVETDVSEESVACIWRGENIRKEGGNGSNMFLPIAGPHITFTARYIGRRDSHGPRINWLDSVAVT